MPAAAPPLRIRGISILTADSAARGVRLLRGQQVVIQGGRFHYVGASEEEARRRCAALAQGAGTGQAPRLLEGRDRLLLPGFANAHAHLAMSLLRNAADDRSLQDWLFREIFPKEERLRPRDVAVGTDLALLELAESGCTATADMYFFPEECARVAAERGFRCNLCLGMIDSDFSLRPYAHAEAFWRAIAAAGEGRLRASLLVHSPYLYPEAAYPKLAEIAAELELDVQLHLSETQREVEDCLRQYGRRPARFLAEAGFFKGRTLAAHAVYLDADEMELLRGTETYLVHNPSSNLKLASGIMPAQRYLDAGLKLALGTDGAASNNKLDLYAELRLAALLGKIPDLDPCALKAESAFLMATAWGYAALGFPEGGRIAEGAPADCQILNLASTPGFWPEHELLAALVYSGDRSLLETLMIEGRMLIENGESLCWDRAKLRAEAQASADHLCAR